MILSSKPYALLRKLMHDRDIDQLYLCQLLDRSGGYVSNRILGNAPWNADEMYKILELLNEPIHRLHEIFPPGGVTLSTKTAPVNSEQRILMAFAKALYTACGQEMG